MKDLPLVSICIPNYNNAEFVGEAIQSALDQTYENIEIIVADNQSTDDSCDIIQSFNSDRRFNCYLNETNLGMVGNFREVLGKAEGKYITFLCSDDLLKKETIENAVKKLEAFPDCAFAFGNIEYIGSRQGQSRFKFPEILEAGEWVKASIKAGGNQAYIAGTVFRKFDEKPENAIVDLVFFDWYLWLKLGKNKVLFADEIVASHRYHENNQTGKLTPGILNNYFGLKKVLTLSYHNQIISTKDFIIAIDKLTVKNSILLYASTLNAKQGYINQVNEGLALCKFESFNSLKNILKYLTIILKQRIFKFFISGPKITPNILKYTTK